MNHFKVLLFTALLSVLGLVLGCEQHSASITIDNLRIYEPIPGSTAAVAYADIANRTGQPQTLLAVKGADFSSIEIHETVQRDGRMSMQRLEAVDIAAQQAVSLREGGKHLMLFNPASSLALGSSVELEFVFGEGLSVRASAALRSRLDD